MGEPVPLRSFLLAEVLRFTLKVAGLPGVSRIALMGSLATSKAAPLDAEVLVSVTTDCSLDRLAAAARALKGHAQTRNSGADLFLADLDGQYLGRICHWRECRPGIRLACRAQHCSRRSRCANLNRQTSTYCSGIRMADPVQHLERTVS